MSAADIANQHFTAALADAKAEGVDSDSLCRSLPQENRSRRLNMLQRGFPAPWVFAKKGNEVTLDGKRSPANEFHA